MGTITITKWQCDFCRKIEDKKPPVDYPRVSMTLREDYEWSGNSVELKEMCPTCNRKMADVAKHIITMMKDARKETKS